MKLLTNPQQARLMFYAPVLVFDCNYAYMASIWRFVALILGPGFLLAIAVIGYAAINTFVFNNCDSKFGCGGGVEFMAFLTGLAFLLSATANAIVSISYKYTILRASPLYLAFAIVVLCMGQGALLLTVDRWPVGTLLSIMFAWFCASFAVGWCVHAVVKISTDNNSSEPKPLR